MSEELFNEYIQETTDFINGTIKKKYLLNNETCYEDIINKRFKNELIKIEPNISRINYILSMFNNKTSLAAGSILSGLGNTEHTTSLSNCYYIPIESDSIEGIYECQKKLAKTFSRRGGSGTSITILRPKGTPVSNSAKTSTGAVSFMPSFSLLAHDIGQNGRRAALIITIDCRHPDVLDFIWCKSKPELVFDKDSLTDYQPNISYANISIEVTNDFMEAAKNDADWNLFFPDTSFEKYDEEWNGDYNEWLEKGYPTKVYKTIKARDLLNQIAEAAWLTGDPGLLFKDNIIKYSTGSFDPKIKPRGVNPCGEQTLQDYGNCLLSCLCLHKYVKNPYTSDAEFDLENYLLDVEHLVYFLDLMIDINKHPLPEQTENDLYSRRIGIEFTALNDMWAMLNLDYGSDKACEFIDDILFTKAVHEIKTSIKLAKEKGHAPCFKYKKSRQAFIDQPYIQRIFKKLLKTNREEIINDILTYGLRNSAFNTVGPTGTLSIISDNCSSGIEPIYNISYERESRLFPDKKMKIVHLPLVKNVGPEILNLSEDEIKKKYHYTSAHDIDFNKRIKVQSTIQKWIDNSISSTINLNNDATIEDIYKIYTLAYEKELKGITIYRDGCKKGILSLGKEPKVKEKKSLITSNMIKEHINFERPEILKVHRSYRYVKFWKKIKVYISVTIDNTGKPFEIFANLPLEAGINNSMYQSELLMEKRSQWEAICRLSSMLLRLNTPVELVIKQLEKSSPIMTEASNIVAQVLKGFVDYSEDKIEEIKTKKIGGMYCDNCQTESIIYQGGCEVCLNCGDSRCG
jgi:ribonucleoside-diphosphate reductase alpha chain